MAGIAFKRLLFSMRPNMTVQVLGLVEALRAKRTYPLVLGCLLSSLLNRHHCRWVLTMGRYSCRAVTVAITNGKVSTAALSARANGG